jgi:hypothetical protein
MQWLPSLIEVFTKFTYWLKVGNEVFGCWTATLARAVAAE